MGAALRLLLFLGATLALGAQNATPPPIDLQRIHFGQWKRELASLKGRIVVVDVWATWCAPCLERFPHVVTLYNQYKDRGVTFVSLCVDDREDPQAVEQARQFLRRQKAAFRNYLMDENITQAFEKLDLLGIPAVFIYDRSGRLRHNFNGDDPNHQFTQKQVEEALARLVADQDQ
ncbi:MAG: TlpA family protein disulfide reductase [Acidobacteria bacterium]|nr:TlpA family protein disulfide reductase [Acidobacteriota bacterium]